MNRPYHHIDLINVSNEECFECIIHGAPHPQRRPRIKIIRRGRVPILQISNGSDREKRLLQGLLRNALPGLQNPLFFMQQPLHVDLYFFMPRPQAHFSRVNGRIQRSAEFLMDRHITQHHINAPDADNMVKFVFDALQEIIYQNDSRIVSFKVLKMYDNEAECKGRTYVKVSKAQFHTHLQYNWSLFDF